MISGRLRALIAFDGVIAFAFAVLGTPGVPDSVDFLFRCLCAVNAVCCGIAAAAENYFRICVRLSLSCHSAALLIGQMALEPGSFLSVIFTIGPAYMQWFKCNLLLGRRFRWAHVSATVLAALAGSWIQDTDSAEDSVSGTLHRRLNHSNNDTAKSEASGDSNWIEIVIVLFSCAVTGMVAIGYFGTDCLQFCRRRRRVHNFHEDTPYAPVVPIGERDSSFVDARAVVPIVERDNFEDTREEVPADEHYNIFEDTLDSEFGRFGWRQGKPYLRKKSFRELRHLAAAIRGSDNELEAILVGDIQRRQLIDCIDAQLREGRLKLCRMPTRVLYKLAASMGGKRDISGCYEAIDPPRYLLYHILRLRSLRNPGSARNRNLCGTCSRRLRQADDSPREFVMGTLLLSTLPPIQDKSGDDKDETEGDADTMTDWESVYTDESTELANVFGRKYASWCRRTAESAP